MHMISPLKIALVAASAMVFVGSASAQNACFTDFNGDGVTDAADVELFKAYMGSTEDDAGFQPAADLNGDGEVGLADYNILLSCMK
jgi:hypothetical protein